MNFYKHHIGDYDADTAHLTWFEDMAYTRLMRLYYRRELPIPADIAQACRLVRAASKQEREAVENVLHEFFELDGDCWRNKRCDEEISTAQGKAAKNREVGKSGGRPAKKITMMVSENNHDGFKKEPCDNPSQKPEARSHNSEANASGGEPPKVTDPNEIIFGYGLPMLTNAGTPEKQARSFLGGLRKQHGDPALIDKLRECAKAKPLQPLEWLAAALPPKASVGSRHSGFEKIDYRAGVGEDGRF